jgi:hypothetical protein
MKLSRRDCFRLYHMQSLLVTVFASKAKQSPGTKTESDNPLERTHGFSLCRVEIAAAFGLATTLRERLSSQVRCCHYLWSRSIGMGMTPLQILLSSIHIATEIINIVNCADCRGYNNLRYAENNVHTMQKNIPATRGAVR